MITDSTNAVSNRVGRLVIELTTSCSAVEYSYRVSLFLPFGNTTIVGSGELIATTTLGAQAGYSALWVVVISCLIKPVIQGELGRYTIATGETGLEALNHLPGLRLGRINWLVWAWAFTVLLTMCTPGVATCALIAMSSAAGSSRIVLPVIMGVAVFET